MRTLFFGVLMACGGTSTDGTMPPTDDVQQPDTDVKDDDGCADLSGEGYGMGDVSMNWTLTDIDGKPVSLHDYCGRVVFIEDTTAW